jgi:hypothetical protein
MLDLEAAKCWSQVISTLLEVITECRPKSRVRKGEPKKMNEEKIEFSNKSVALFLCCTMDIHTGMSRTGINLQPHRTGSHFPTKHAMCVKVTKRVTWSRTPTISPTNQKFDNGLFNSTIHTWTCWQTQRDEDVKH